MFGSRLETRRFEKSILKYESVPVQTGMILFYGHSLFTHTSWITKIADKNPKIEECVRMKDGSQAILNHGFGTSSADDLLYYYDRMVRPYKPRALVLATMGNDIGFGYSAKDVMEIQARIIQWAKADFPGIPVYCFSTGMSVKHKNSESVYTRVRDEYNEFLKAYCDVTEGCTYVPLHEQPFLFDDPADAGDINKIREDLFLDDMNHLNAKGYALFMDFIRQLLDDLL